MANKSKPKPVKAWAIVNAQGKIKFASISADDAETVMWEEPEGSRIIRVTITPDVK